MIRCAASRGSSSARLFVAARQTYSTPATPLSLKDLEREFGISDGNYKTPTIDIGLERRHRRDTADKDGHTAEQSSATTKPLKRRELPTSPYMDPETIAAKEKYRTPKPKARPIHQLTQFGKQIAKNPYARALATPVRACRATNVTLPRFFLQDLNLVVHPETKEPWWVPRGLARKYPLPWGKEDAKENNLTTQGSEEGKMHSVKEIKESEPEAHYAGVDESGSTNNSSSKELPSSTRSMGPKSYILSRQHALAGLPKGKPLAKLQILGSSFPIKVRDRGSLQQIIEKAKIRPDIDTFVLELLRRRASEQLAYVTKLGAYILKCADWKEAIMPETHASAILWIGGVPEEQREFDSIIEPPEFATVDIVTKSGKRRIPVHNLEMLLGGEHLQRLKDTFDIFKEEFLIIKNARLTVELEMKLWQLQGFLAEYRQFLDVGHSEEDKPAIVQEEEMTRDLIIEGDKH